MLREPAAPVRLTFRSEQLEDHLSSTLVYQGAKPDTGSFAAAKCVEYLHRGQDRTDASGCFVEDALPLLRLHTRIEMFVLDDEECQVGGSCTRASVVWMAKE
jgi:hypothetical protein